MVTSFEYFTRGCLAGVVAAVLTGSAATAIVLAVFLLAVLAVLERDRRSS